MINVFISWSGTRAQRVAVALSEFLGDVIPSAAPFVSAEDIQKGSRWESEIAQALDRAQFGIVCITRDRLTAPWLLFEAGALSRSVEGSLTQSRVATLLIDIDDPADVHRPLGQFQSTKAEESDVLRLVSEINTSLGSEATNPDRLERWFAAAWPTLAAVIEEARSVGTESSADSGAVENSGDDLESKLDEIIGFIRSRDREPVRKIDSNVKVPLAVMRDRIAVLEALSDSFEHESIAEISSWSLSAPRGTHLKIKLSIDSDADIRTEAMNILPRIRTLAKEANSNIREISFDAGEGRKVSFRVAGVKVRAPLDPRT